MSDLPNQEQNHDGLSDKQQAASDAAITAVAAPAPGTASGATASEGDFGFSLSAEGGVRLSDHLGLLAVGHGSWALMASSNNGVQAGFGLGLRVDHVGPLTGHFTLGASGSLGSIIYSNDKVPSLSLSGGAVALSYSQPVNGLLGVDVRFGWHFLSNDFSLLVLSAGISFGN